MEGPNLREVRLATSSGVEVIVALVIDGQSVQVVATAVPSTITKEHDAAYALELERWLALAHNVGGGSAGAPPASGAARFLTELVVEPPPSLRGVGQCVEYIGGTSTEWTRRWTWAPTQQLTHGQAFEIRSAVAADTLRIS
jgi:hypothetical protein